MKALFAGILVAIIAVAMPLSPVGSSQPTVQNWYESWGKSQLGGMQKEVHNIDVAKFDSFGITLKMVRNCALLHGDSRISLRIPKIPDSALEAEWVKMNSRLHSDAERCIAAIRVNSVEKMKVAKKYIAQDSKLIMKMSGSFRQTEN